MPQRNLTWLLIVAVVSLTCHAEARRNRFAGILSESIDKISRYYVEPVDPRALFDGGMRGMLNELDPYSGYISPDMYNQFRVDIEQQFGGIGIEVGIENERITILNPVPGTPAYDQGLMAGDVIMAIDGHDTTGFTLDDAVKLMRGPEGTIVRVEVLPHGAEETKTYEIQRARITVESVRGDARNQRGEWSFVLQENPRIGYIRLMSFGDRTVEELQASLESVDGQVDGLIMDLRGNAGGLLTAAVDVCDMFIGPNQIVVTTRGRDPAITKEFTSQHPPLVDPQLPVVVLVDRYSASASEIFAACLQDYDRATIVGERTWGKGTVQNVLEIEGGKSAIRLTTQTYWRPSGKNIHRHQDDPEDAAWGVSPAPQNTIPVEADEFRQVQQRRRDRDYGDMRSNSAPIEETTETTPPAPVEDRQLQRAIQVLLEKIKAPESRAA